MKLKCVVLFVLYVAAFSIPHSVEAQATGTEVFRQEGIASWYGREFDGRPTASGEIYDSSQLTAAHLTLPFGTIVVVTNRHNNKRVTVRINDRGPFVSARVIDVSRAAAEQLDMIITGTAPVLLESIDRIVVSSSALTPPPASRPVTGPVQTLPPVIVSPPVYTPAAPQTVPDTEHGGRIFSPVPDVYVPPQTVPQTPVTPQRYDHVRLTPEINIAQNKVYRLQVGSYKVARNAVEAFERLKNSGLNPNYERHTEPDRGEFFRVVVAGIRGSDVQSVLGRLGSAGFREALIREE